MNFDEELTLLEEAVRKLKIEYDIFFAGGSKRPPTDTEWRVSSLIKRLETTKLTFAQRFRYNSILQKYAIHSDLWRQKTRIKEEGYRRPQDALLAIQGLRDEHTATKPVGQGRKDAPAETFRIACSNPDTEPEAVRSLFTAMAEAKRKVGEFVPESSFESFRSFVKRKTEQIRKEYGCPSVEYAVESVQGQVRLKAKARNARTSEANRVAGV
ncbi:MAG TPA: MXAN_5187 C-terminal domain-containing protein [Terriglobales bacterium]|nr:MXAN_5187 C-terminal domain-containing protein [Terriglobales bacterium]